MTIDQVRPPQAFPPELGRWPVVLTSAAQLAERIANTDFVPRAMRGKPDVIVAAIMYGDELGIGPMQALAGINMIEGRPAPSSELLRALIYRAGHQIVVHEMSPQRCRVSGLRAGRPEAERVYVEWTLDMARAAGLANKQNWRQYPRGMLLARATGDLARAAFPDVVRGLGHIADTDDSLRDLETWSGPDDGGQATQPPPLEAPPAPARPPIQRQTQPRRTTPIESTDDLDKLRPEEQPTEPPVGPRDRPGDPSAARPPVAPQTIAQRPLTAIHALVGELIPQAERGERLALLEAIVRRRLESSSDLTRAEGYDALDWLNRIKVGEAYMRIGDDGVYEVGMADEAMPLEGVEVEELPTPDPWADPAEREAELRRQSDRGEGGDPDG